MYIFWAVGRPRPRCTQRSCAPPYVRGIGDHLEYELLLAMVNAPSGNEICGVSKTSIIVKSMVCNKYVHNDEID